MSQVFISYRQTDHEQRKRVRDFAQSLRDRAVDVVLDQFFLEANPGGPDEGWDKWSSDRALYTDYVLIVGTEAWFQCFEKTQPPGTGPGAACEADDLRHRHPNRVRDLASLADLIQLLRLNCCLVLVWF